MAVYLLGTDYPDLPVGLLMEGPATVVESSRLNQTFFVSVTGNASSLIA